MTPHPGLRQCQWIDDLCLTSLEFWEINPQVFLYS